MATADPETRINFSSDLASLVALPTVSSSPDSENAIHRAVELAADKFEQSGLTTKIVTTPGNPVVHGQYEGNPDWPTVLVYNHLDVQPADANEWQTDPFTMVEQEDAYYGRGTTDDKGPALVGLYAIANAIQNNVPLNFQVVWETEEEIGSPNFDSTVKGLAGELAIADSVLVSDTMWRSADKPSIIYGLRGLVGFKMRLQTLENDAHSGLTGGVAVNPINMLAKVIASFTDAKTGRITIPGFYDDITPVSDEEVAQLLASGFSLKQFMEDYGLLATTTDDESVAVRAIMTEPTLDVNGITGGYTGSLKTIIPHEASAFISSRLVPGQTPERVFQAMEEYVRAQAPLVELEFHSGAPPYVTDLNSPHAQAITAAYKETLGLDPVFVREGGSIGAVLSLDEVTKAPVILAGLSLPTDGYHAVNEHFEWRQAKRGIDLFGAYFAKIARIPKK